MLTCQYCTDPKQLKLFNFPHGHQHADSKRACADCWEGWLSAQVEEKPANQIRCIDDDCSAVITRAELDKLARKGTLDRYDSKIQLSRGLRCMNRCSAPQTSPIQIHDPTVHGRIFTCQLCLFDVCTTCDRPEHFGESCEEYLEREATAHGKDEALTMEDHWPCPGCNVTIELEERGCGFTVCKTCNFRFCQDCLIGWVGEGSEYELGAAAHEPGCNYTVKYSAHSLKYIKDKRSKTLKEAAEKRKIGEKKAAEAKKRKADDQDAEVEAEKVSKKAKHQMRGRRTVAGRQAEW